MISWDIEFNYSWTDFWLLPNVSIETFTLGWKAIDIGVGIWCWRLHFLFWIKKELEDE
jgi:hypothetical protein